MVAYEDKAFPLLKDKPFSQPYTVAYQSQLLEIKPYEKYWKLVPAAVTRPLCWAEMNAQVYTIERQKNCLMKHKEVHVRGKLHRHQIFYGDGYEGLPTYALLIK